MEHKLLTINHVLETWTYANAAARTGAGGFVPGDLGRVAFQQDTGQYWRLTGTTPAWQIISGSGGGFASYQGVVASPTGTSNIVYPGVMMAVPGTITPTTTGKILFSIAGTWSNTTLNAGGQAALRYGTGAKPANGVAATGTPVGAVTGYDKVAATAAQPLSLTAFVSGLTIGTAYWLDVSVNAATGGTVSLSNVTICAVELP